MRGRGGQGRGGVCGPVGWRHPYQPGPSGSPGPQARGEQFCCIPARYDHTPSPSFCPGLWTSLMRGDCSRLCSSPMAVPTPFLLACQSPYCALGPLSPGGIALLCSGSLPSWWHRSALLWVPAILVALLCSALGPCSPCDIALLWVPAILASSPLEGGLLVGELTPLAGTWPSPVVACPGPSERLGALAGPRQDRPPGRCRPVSHKAGPEHLHPGPSMQHPWWQRPHCPRDQRASSRETRPRGHIGGSGRGGLQRPRRPPAAPFSPQLRKDSPRRRQVAGHPPGEKGGLWPEHRRQPAGLFGGAFLAQFHLSCLMIYQNW